MSFARAIAFAIPSALLAASLGACARPSGSPITPEPSPLCVMRTDGAVVRGPTGEAIVLHGGSLPSLGELDKAGRPAEEALRALAANGATVVRLLVRDAEVGPTFVPGRIEPFVEAAQRLGMTVVLAWDNNVAEQPKNQTDDAEDWVRIALTYLRNRPGVWFDPFANEVKTDPVRKRIGAQRIVDVVRGLGADNIVLITDAGWLAETDPELGRPLAGGNVVYAAARIDATIQPWIGRVPMFIVGETPSVAAEGLDGSIAGADADPRASASLWRASAPCR